MNKESKRNFLEIKKEKITRKQKRIRLRNRTYIRNDFLVVTNTNPIREIRDY